MGHEVRRHEANPLVSLITVVLNGGDTVSRTFESVFAQYYQPIEYIVIDGGSTDGSVDLIRQHETSLAYWISEPDRGISDAFNKGLEIARGDYIGLLNADDWLSPDQIGTAVRTLQSSKAGFVFGDLLYHAPNGTPLHQIQGDSDYISKIRSRMPALNHPTMLVKRQVFNDIGGFDRRYQVAMDYDWVLRAHLAGHRGRYAETILGHMTLAGTSDQQFVRSLLEVRQIATRHGQSAIESWILFSFRLLKGLIRRGLHRFGPKDLYRLLRRWVNRDYRAVSPDLADRCERNPSS